MTASDRPDGPFSPTVLGFLVASVVAIFALSVFLSTLDINETPFQATADSPSAIGYKGLVALLESVDLPVTTSRYKAAASVGHGDLLIVAEPGRDARSFGAGTRNDGPPNVLLVLPKWVGTRDVLHDGWVSRVELASVETPRRILHFVDRGAILLRAPALPPSETNTIGAKPSFDGTVQLISHSTLRPLIGTPDAMLLGERMIGARRIWVLADPDPIENHGLSMPANARFAMALVEAARGGAGRIVFDEKVHGTVAPDRNVLQLLFRFPFVIVTTQVIVALVLLLLATTTRFGGVETAPVPFALGKLQLIEQIAALMERAGHQAVILRRYVRVRLGETARGLHAPAALDEAALAAWIDGIGRSRGLAISAAAIDAEATRATRLPALFAQARDANRLKKDILGDPGRRQSDR